MLSKNENFIEKAIKVHGDKYDYSKVEYIDYLTPVCIICPKHGEFWQKPNTHLGGSGCQKCGKEERAQSHMKLKYTTEEIIQKAKEKYGDKYDYSEVVYRGARKKITIIFKETGRKYEITPDSLLNKGFNCKRDLGLTTEDWIKKAKHAHGDKYDYSITEYRGSKKKIKYICPKHGVIEQYPDNHLRYGCRFCSYEEYGKLKTLNTEHFINEAKKVHGDKYDYSKSDYKGNHTKVCIICPKHGEFWQTPAKHLSGQGCPECKNSILEEKVSLFLKKKNIEYIPQYSPEFLKNGKGKQKIDFYLPKYKVAIECQGIQHFVSSPYTHKTTLEKNVERDIRKFKKCTENNIKILYYTTKDNIKFGELYDIYNKDNLFDDLEEIIKRLN